MRISILEGNEICDFTYDEDMALAGSVMSVLENRGAFYEHTCVANDLYYAGTNGHVIRLSVLEQFLEATIKLIIKYDDYGKAELAPVLFDPSDDGVCQQAPKNELNGINNSEWYTAEQVRAWREVWELHRAALSRIDDCYRVFPGDEEGQSRENDRVLTKFFQEVIATMTRYKMGYHQVMTDVMDRSHHAGLGIDELAEIKDKYWDEAQRRFKEEQKKKRKMSPKMLRIKEMIAKRNLNVCDGGSDKKTKPVNSRLSEVEAKKAYDKELEEWQEYMNRGKAK